MKLASEKFSFDTQVPRGFDTLIYLKLDYPICTIADHQLATSMCAFVPYMSQGLANPVWRLAYGSFDKIVFSIDTLFDDCLDQAPFFGTSAPVCP